MKLRLEGANSNFLAPGDRKEHVATACAFHKGRRRKGVANSHNRRGAVSEEIRCPDCESLNVEEISDEVIFGSEEAHDESAKKTKPHKYECLDCRFVFFKRV
jgi:hypothetical protein